MFAIAKCGHCGHTGTKLAQIEPATAAYKQTAICCSSCNAILGITGYYDTGTLLKKAEKEREAIKQQISRLEHTIQQIAHMMQMR